MLCTGELSDNESVDDDEAESDDEEVDKPELESKDFEMRASRGKSSKPAGIRGEMAALRAELGAESESVPHGEESLKEFFARTSSFWNEKVVVAWRERGEDDRLSEKEIKREAFKLAEARYNELLPSLAKLKEIEDQQAEMEDNGRAKRSSRR